MKSIYPFIIIILCVAQGCSTFAHYTGYIKGNIKVIGSRNAYANDAVFYDIEIKYNKKNKPQKKPYYFSIKLLNGTIVFSKKFTYKYISSIPNIKKHISKENNKITYFKIDGFFFSFYKNKLTFFGTDRFQEGKEYNPVIGNEDGTKFYKFPLTQNQLEDLFGKPDKYENKHS